MKTGVDSCCDWLLYVRWLQWRHRGWLVHSWVIHCVIINVITHVTWPQHTSRLAVHTT